MDDASFVRSIRRWGTSVGADGVNVILIFYDADALLPVLRVHVIKPLFDRKLAQTRRHCFPHLV